MKDSPTLEEELRLIRQILAGASRLFHELIRPYERSVYLMALSLLRNEADAEDVAQEAFLKAFRNLATFRGEAKFGTWLISIALNESRSESGAKMLLLRNLSMRRPRDTAIFPRSYYATGKKYHRRLWSGRRLDCYCRMQSLHSR